MLVSIPISVKLCPLILAVNMVADLLLIISNKEAYVACTLYNLTITCQSPDLFKKIHDVSTVR